MEWATATSVLALVLIICCCNTISSRQPHIILVLADDLGYNDIGYHNQDILTPNIDLLARQGLILEQSYVQPACTPSRSALMTGMYPYHIGRQGPPILPACPTGLTLARTLLPEALKKAGYKTHAVGKWHLGYCKPDYLPTNRGFDTHYGFWTGGQDYYNKTIDYTFHAYDFHENEAPLNNPTVASTYSMFLYDERVNQIIRQHDPNDPLLLYLALQTPHLPLQVPKKYEDLYPNVEDGSRKTYMGMVSAMDEVMGSLMDTLKSTGLYDNTILVFISDNGGETRQGGASNYPLKGNKGDVFEGGVRTPSFIHSPLLPKHGRATSRQLLHITDWYPTLLKVGQVSQDDYNNLSKGIDGLDQYSVLFGDQDLPTPRSTIVHEMTVGADGKPSGALRVADWKLIVNPQSPGPPPSEPQPLLVSTSCGEDNEKYYQLYNVIEDPEESADLANLFPDILNDMLLQFEMHYATMVPEDRPPDAPGGFSDDNGNLQTGWCSRHNHEIL